MDFEEWFVDISQQTTFFKAGVCKSLAKAAWEAATTAEREACAKQLELNAQDVMLMAGEMTRGELRAVMAVLSCLRVRMRSNKG